MSGKTSWFQRLRFRIAGMPRAPSGGFFESILRGQPIPAFKRFQKLPGKLAEAVKEATAEKGLFIPAFKARMGEQPTITLATLVDYYLKDPMVMGAVDSIAEQIAAPGFYTVSELGFEEAKKLVDEFCAGVNMDSLLMQTSKEIVFSGNCFWEKIRSTKPGDEKKIVSLKILPLSSMAYVQRDKFGRVQTYFQVIGSDKVEFAPDEIIHFKLNAIDGSAWGIGILHSLASTKQIDERTVRPAFLDIKARLEDDIQKIVHRYAAPKRLWKFLGVSDEKLRTEYTPAIQDAPADADFATNKEVEVNSLDINPGARFDGFIEHINVQIVQGLQTFITRLLTSAGYTEASSTVADKVSQRKIGFIQRFIARIIEKEVFEVILREAGQDPVKAGVRLRWGMADKPQIEFADMVQLAQISATSGIEYVTRDEVRNYLAKNTGFELQKQTEQKEKPTQQQPKETKEAMLQEVWDETDQYIRRRIRNPAEFEEGSLRTVWFSQDQGIKAVTGRPKGEDKTAVQSILFSKEKGWTRDKAEAWIKDHPDLQVSESDTVQQA